MVVSRDTESSKGGIKIKEYSLSRIGKTIAVIVDFILSGDRPDKYNRFFNDWTFYLSDTPSSLDLFCLAYLEKCKQENLFNEFVEYYIKSIIYDNNNIFVKSYTDLFTHMILVRVTDKQKNQRLFYLWQKTFDELDHENKELFLHHISTHINRIIFSKAQDIAKFELKRLNQRHLHNCIITEFCCSFCGSFFDYREMSVFSYLHYLFGHSDNIAENIIDKEKCPYCNEQKYTITIIP